MFHVKPLFYGGLRRNASDHAQLHLDTESCQRESREFDRRLEFKVA
jgi:hypothetical protein